MRKWVKRYENELAYGCLMVSAIFMGLGWWMWVKVVSALEEIRVDEAKCTIEEAYQEVVGEARCKEFKIRREGDILIVRRWKGGEK